MEMPDRDQLRSDLQDALNHLYDYEYLRQHAIQALLPADARGRGRAIQLAITNAIERMKPLPVTPQEAVAWRLYYILFYRFVQGLTVTAVASRLAISERHLKREQQRATAALLEVLLEARSDDTPPDNPLEAEIQMIQRHSMPTNIALPRLLNEVLVMLERAMRARHIDVDIHIEESIPAVVAHPQILRQILVAAAGIVLRHGPEGRMAIGVFLTEMNKVAVQFQMQACLNTSGAETVTFLPAESEPFDTIRDLAASAGVTLRIQSEDALDFTLDIPAAKALPILIVEDNPDTLTLYRRHLVGTGYQVHSTDANSVGEAMATLRPTALILDLMMPDRDGWDVLIELRNDPATAALPILVCSALPDNEIALSLGATRYQQKPIDQQTLIGILDELTGSQHSTD